MKQPAQLMAMIYVDSVDDARAYYVDRLGFTHVMGMLGKDGRLDFCTVSLGGARIMLMRPTEGMTGTGPTTTPRPVELYLEVADVDAHHAQVKAHNISPSAPLTDQWWGDRTFTVRDPYGYQIWFYQTVAEAKLPAGAKVV